MKKLNKIQGFTLIEILVVIGIIAVLAAIVIVAINPAKQFAQARNTQRTSDTTSILNAIGQRMADNKGVFAGTFTINSVNYTCPALPTTAARVTDGAGTGTDVDLDCLVPTYISILPKDPSGPTAPDTGYEVNVDAVGRVRVCAPDAATETAVPSTGSICITR